MHNDSILDIKEILNDYSTDIQTEIVKSAQEVAKKGRDTLRNTSPRRTGSYRKGWTVKTEKGRNTITCIIYNKTDYRLTHLLEKPHLKRNGGYTKPIVHIQPVDETCVNEFEKQVENIIKNGG